MSKNLFKTTVVIWTDYDPAGQVELSELARDAESGEGYCAYQQAVAVPFSSVATDPHGGDGVADFFDLPVEDDGDTAARPDAGAPAPKGPGVSATLRADDGSGETAFDATAWFETATAPEIRDLIECGFGGDYPADAVAGHFHGIHPQVTEILDHCQGSETGFEVHVSAAQAIAWIAVHRGSDTALMTALAATDDLD